MCQVARGVCADNMIRRYRSWSGNAARVSLRSLGKEHMATRHTCISGSKNWIILNASGTMTDAVSVDTDGSFLIDEFLTNNA